MKAYSLTHSLFWTTIKHPSWAITTIVIALISVLPAFAPTAMPAYFGNDPLYYDELYEIIHQYFTDGTYDTVPDSVLPLFQAEDEALYRVVSAKNNTEYFSTLTDYMDAQLNIFDAGHMTGVERFNLESHRIWYSELSKLKKPETYFYSDSMPALHYLSFVFAQNASMFWLLPTIVASCCAMTFLNRGKLIGAAPSSSTTSNIAATLTALVAGILSTILSVLPGFCIALLKNGLGDPSYPVVFTQNGKVLYYTLIETLGKQLLLWLLSVLLITCIIIALGKLFRSPLIASAFTLALCLFPTMAGYMSTSAQQNSALSLLPFFAPTYLSFGPITGYPGVFLAVELLSIPGVSYERGVSVLCLTTLAVIAIAVVVNIVINKYCSSRRCAHVGNA